MATLAMGFLLLITRLKAITQVIGYLILENGIFLFGILLAEAMPLMVETGVLLDMLVAIFVMGIVMNHINREFSSINTEKLCLLRE
jgi:hydrogenase-4 component E